MASGDSPPRKKLKVKEEKEDTFMSFHKNHLKILKDGLSLFDNNVSRYGVGLIKIKLCNALSSKCFSSAVCDGEQLYNSGEGCSVEPEGFKIRGIFQYGFKIMEAYIKSPECLPQRKGARLAFAKLLKFLSDFGTAEKALYQGRNDTSETEWTAIVAHHLLSKLALGSNYTLDNISKGRIKDLYCTCGCEERLMGVYGDTSMGVPSYWHGRVDILMDVAVTLAIEQQDSPGAGNSSSVEMKTTSDKMITCQEQIRAETIVFSFLQKKNHPELNSFLIPTIAMSKSHVAICLYDCVNDIFLETPRLDLFEEEFLKIETIITLWLVLNYRYSCYGVPKEIMEVNFKADFFKHIGEHMEKYRSDVRAPCCFQSQNKWTGLRVLKDVQETSDDINNICQPSKIV